LGLDPFRHAAAHARPRLHGLAPGPVTGGVDEINPDENRAPPGCGAGDRGGPTTESTSN